jgi:pyridoxal phosphate enzyme (YggS family)
MLKERYRSVRERIRRAALGCGRPVDSVRLVAVSKTVPAERVAAAIEAGIDVFGENYIQEARAKIEALADRSVTWHFIGHLQSNKAKYAVRLFDLIHSVDSLKLAAELDKEAAKRGRMLKILIQVNVSGEASKSGVAPQDTLPLIREVSALRHVQTRGLMTMPPFFDDPEGARPYFRELRLLAEKIRPQAPPGVEMAELSMGMTGDFEAAIEEGATLVRIGTAIFGERP